MEKENIILKRKEDYICWKDYVSLVIDSKELSEVFEKDVESTKAQKAKALTIIKKHLDFSLHHVLHGIRNPVEAFDLLEKYCIGNKEIKLMHLENELDNVKGRFFLEKINNFNVTYRNFVMLGGEMANNKVIYKLLNLAPATTSVELLKHDVEVSVSGGRSMNYNEVFTKLQRIAEISQELYLKKMKSTSAFLCFKCNQPGHKKYECNNEWYCSYCKKSGHSQFSCRNKIKNENQNENNNSFAGAFIGVLKSVDFTINSVQRGSQSGSSLILDSGASYHVCGENHLGNFTEIQELTVPKYVSTAGGKVYASYRKGRFESVLENGKKIILNDVFIFKELQVFLISIAVLLNKGLTLVAKENEFTILKEKKIIYKAQKSMNNLFLVKCKSFESDKVMAMKSSKKSLLYYHILFGHQGEKAFLNTMKYFNIECKRKDIENLICDTCNKVNLKKAVIKKKNAVGFKAEPGTMFVLDTVAVLATSRAGNVGFLLVTDVETKYRYIYCYKNKSEVAEEVINYVKKFQRLSGIKLKQMHSDQGTEFVNQRIIEFCAQEGIKFTTSAAYVPQHNGIAERSNQFILSKMRQLISMLEIEKSFYWDFAAYYSVYITNRVTEGGTDISSYEKIYNKKPKLYRFYIFGSLIVYVQKTENKIQSKGTYGYFMGYNPATGEALIVDKISRQLIKTRDFKSIRNSENLFGNEEKNIQSEIKIPLNIGVSDQNENTMEVETNEISTDTIQNENNEGNYVRRSTRVTKMPDRLTYDQANIRSRVYFSIS
eukprot:snap_masked-scaffold_2-processed-gene-4.22-mRNA-1 protein AED:1.00 eAED:1.00 QI:0/0/0/0/1/1/2/0/771